MTIRLNVEIADTLAKQEAGLMFRKKLGNNEGMLFVFNKPMKLNFWGLNTFLCLSIVYVSPENKIIKIDRIKPLSFKTISSDRDCIMAIEANEGFFSKNGIKVGDKINVGKDDLGFDVVDFLGE